MKRLLYTIFILTILICSCNRNEFQDARQYGYLTVGVSDDVDVDILFKSEEEEENPDAATDGSESDENGTEENDPAEPTEPIVYEINIYNADDPSTDEDGEPVERVPVFKCTDHNELIGQPVPLLMGRYEVKAHSGVPETGFNSPYWSGENTARVYPEKEANVSITCRMKKVIFSVEFPEDEQFKNNFVLYELKVTNGEHELIFSSAPQVDNPIYGSFEDVAYFTVSEDRTLRYTLRIKNNQGKEYTETKEIKNVSAAEHYHFKYAMGESEDVDGALVLNVHVDGEYNAAISHEILLNFDRLEMPSYSHNEEFDPDLDGLVYPLGNDITKKLYFNAPRKIKSLTISHLDANLLTEGLPQVLEFVDISSEDKAIADELGIIATSVTSESVSAEIDITEFVKNLPISPDNQPYLVSFTVIDSDNRYAQCDFEFAIVSDIQAEPVSAFRWSGFAILKGRFFSRDIPEGISFQYKKKSDSDWEEIPSDLMEIDMNTLTYTYLLNRLVPDTEYVFRATSDKDKNDGKTSSEVEFKTYAFEGTINNMSLDAWYADGQAYYPNATSSTEDWVWDTANGGTKSLGVYPTNPESSIVAVSGEGKKAAKMVSQYATLKFAAGNIYTGKFAKVDLASAGAELDWGVPFESRPLALKGYFRYEPVAIDYVGSGYDYLKGKPDLCQIQMFLTDWTSPFRIKANGSSPVFVDFSADYIIAHGEIITDQNTTQMSGNVNGYIPFVIPIEYRTLKDPRYIVISAAASRYGDYFTGGSGSTLYLDELEFVYDPSELTDEQFEFVMKNIY